ncbi:4-aminobutyrate--2-oxoglutarate transaminase [Campylobacter troglodytis]|uniref:4-aminobutyrate--2-oxoglutarate transaminase n=1 Tax=Campylobacter troglodytis TaxID=654363 RepID=UPI001158F81C|nr:4-aminobutyrate--2-oxoglutarate transaminase [Campylobacter troglodytis]TQR59569.1 4-aminobutyrate--2-oxoglutarate transaminase [Campylobacter troglodytis]
MKDLKARKEDATPRGINVLCDWFVAKAQNSTIWDTTEREFIDFAAGIAVLNVGHRHPRIIKAVEKQLKAFTHTAYQISPYESYIELAEKINKLAPIDGKKKTCFFTTGGEATENAIKVAKAHTKRYAVIAFGGSFHGRTAAAVGMTGKVVPYKADLGPGMIGIYHGLYPNALHKITVEDALRSLDHICKSSISPYDVAAIIFEPVQGEGGFYPAPKDFVKGLREFADQYGIVLIADEVQTGFARTGKLFAMEHFDVTPDLLCMAKSLGGGLPISGLCGKAKIMDAVNPGGLGGTYAGNPLATVAGLEVLKIIKEENLLQRAKTLGNTLQAFLKNLKHKEIAEIRALGSMVAVEFFKDGQPSSELAKKVQALAMEEGLLLLTCGSYGNVIRFLYPLTIPDQQFQKALEILKKVIAKAVK